MNKNTLDRRWTAAWLAALALTTALAACGDDDEGAPGISGIPTSESLAGFSFECENGRTQTQQSPFQQQAGCTVPPQQQQKLVFKDNRVAEFDYELDCDRRVVTVTSRGPDPQSRTLSVGSDGTVQGQLSFQQQLQQDGKGTALCWVEYVVRINGRARCEAGGRTIGQIPAPTGTPSPTPTGTPSPMSTATDDTGKALELTTVIDFRETDARALIAAGVADPGDVIEQPGAAATPTPSPTPTGTATPSPTPTVTVTVTPSPIPTVTVTPIRVCPIQDVCPVEAKTDLSCGP